MQRIESYFAALQLDAAGGSVKTTCDEPRMASSYRARVLHYRALRSCAQNPKAADRDIAYTQATANQQSDNQMLEFFRSFMKSKLGVAMTLGFLALIALAFASGDILSFGSLGGASAGTTVATAGSRKINANALDFFARRALEQAKRRDASLNLRSLVAAGGLEQVLEGLLDNAALSAFGEKTGIIAGDRLVGSELAKESAFRGNNGNFDDATYRAALAQQGFSDTVYRQLISDQLVSQQIQIPAAFGAHVPNELVVRYAALLTETREGSIALIPSAAFAPQTPPADADLAKYYAAHRNTYSRPERRTIRYVTFDDTVLKNVPAPSDAEVAARYNTDKAKYAASETRKLTQLVLSSQAAANEVLASLGKGISLDRAAQSRKLATAQIPAITKETFSSQNSAAVADAVFAAAQGKIVGPVKGGLGWYLVKVDGIDRKPGKTLDQAHAEIITALSSVKKRAALADFSARIESEFDGGSALSDVAKELGAEIKQTETLTADGKVFGKPDQVLPPEVQRVVQTAFLMEQEGQPQLAEVDPGKTFVVFDVTNIQQSAPAPLSEVKVQVTADYQLERGEIAARAAAAKVEAAGRKGGDLRPAMAALGAPVPPVDVVSMKRADIRRYGPQVPAPLALLFSMAQGTVKQMAAPNNRGWYVIALKTIIPGKVDPKDPGLASASQELGQLAGREYADQLRRAIRADVGAKTDDANVKALAKQLSGTN